MNYLISVVQTIRVPNVEEVEKLHAEMKRKYDLKKFEYTHKEVKEKKEVVDEYELVKATIIFNNEKEPECYVDATYSTDYGYFPEPIEKDDAEDEDTDEDGGIDF